MYKIIGQSIASEVGRKGIIYTTWSVLAEKENGGMAVCVVVIPSEQIQEDLSETAINLLFYRAFGGIVNVRATVEKLMMLTNVRDVDVYVSLYRTPADPVDVARDMLENFA